MEVRSWEEGLGKKRWVEVGGEAATADEDDLLHLLHFSLFFRQRPSAPALEATGQ